MFERGSISECVSRTVSDITWECLVRLLVNEGGKQRGSSVTCKRMQSAVISSNRSHVFCTLIL